MVYRKRYAARRKALRRFKRARGKVARRKRAGSALVGPAAKRRRVVRMPRQLSFAGSIRSMIPRTRVITQVYQMATDAQRFGTSGVMDPGVIYTATGSINVVNPFDPDPGVIGFYNQRASMHVFMSKLYNRCEVLSCKVKYIFRQQTTEQVDLDIGVGVRLDDNNAITNANQSFLVSRNDPRNKTNILKCNSSPRGIATIWHYWSRRSLGASQRSNTEALNNANPATTYYTVPYVGALEPGFVNAMPHIYISATAWYRVKWSDPVDLTGTGTGMEQQ